MPAEDDKSVARETKGSGAAWGIGLVSGIAFYTLVGGGVATYLFTHGRPLLSGLVFAAVILGLASFLLAKTRKK